MPYLQSNIPHFKCWVRREYTHNHTEYTGNIVALPNNRVRVTHPAWFNTGEGAPDFRPSQNIHYSKSDLDYTLDVNQIFDNIYNETGED